MLPEYDDDAEIDDAEDADEEEDEDDDEPESGFQDITNERYMTPSVKLKFVFIF